jgi:hypothetical protein
MLHSELKVAKDSMPWAMPLRAKQLQQSNPLRIKTIPKQRN